MQSINQEGFSFKTDSFRAGAVWEILTGWNQHRQVAASALASAIHARQARQRTAANTVSELINPRR
jgi:hypothetical protein